MKHLLQNIRFYVLTGNIVASLLIYSWIQTYIPQGQLQIIRLEQTYAFLAIIYLYISLMIGPFCYTFSHIPYRAEIVKARRAIGVSAFYFALLHSWMTFFNQLGGFSGLEFLNMKFLLTVIFGFFALLILFFLTITSFDYAVAKMKFTNWKLLHRFIYLAGIFVLIHTYMIGSHFIHATGIISQIVFGATALLLFFEASRLEIYLKTPRLSISALFLITIIGIYLYISSLPNGTVSFGIHQSHTTTAGLHQHQVLQLFNTNAVKINENSTITFQIYDTFYGKLLSIPVNTIHGILFSSDFTYFTPLALSSHESIYTATARLPKEGTYYVFVTFQGHIPETLSANVTIGNPLQSEFINFLQNPFWFYQTNKLAQTIGTDEVTLQPHFSLLKNTTNTLLNLLTIAIQDTQTKKSVTNLQKYDRDSYGRSTYGYMTAINQQTYESIYLEPTVSNTSTLQFIPTLNSFTKGTYRIFFEFKQYDMIHAANFTLHVE